MPCLVPRRMPAWPSAITLARPRTLTRPLSSCGTAPTGRSCPPPTGGRVPTMTCLVCPVPRRAPARRWAPSTQAPTLARPSSKSWNGTTWSLAPSPSRGRGEFPRCRVLCLGGRLHGRRHPRQQNPHRLRGSQRVARTTLRCYGHGLSPTPTAPACRGPGAAVTDRCGRRYVPAACRRGRGGGRTPQSCGPVPAQRRATAVPARSP